MKDTEFSQKIISLIPGIITGRKNENELLDMYSNLIKENEFPKLDILLDERNVNNHKIEFYSKLYGEHEKFMERSGIEIDYSDMTLTEKEWIEKMNWRKENIEPYLLTRAQHRLYRIREYIKHFLTFK